MSRLTIIFLTVFIDLIGFGIVLPLLPFFGQELGASPAVIGLIVGIHPGMQLVFGPIWGRWSDRIGRRPILLLGLVGSAVSYLLFALATNLWWLFLSRAMAGIAGANVPVAQAYIADSTELHDRTRGMGLIGAAFGLGFIAGPAIGGVLVEFGYAVPGFFAAGLSLANAIAAFFYLPESLRHELRVRARRVTGLIGRLHLAAELVRSASVRQLLAIYTLMTFAFSAFTTTFPLWVGADLGYDARHTGYLLAYFGLLMAGVQGRMIGPLARRFPEHRLLVVGAATLVPAYFLLPLAHTLWLTGGVLMPLALGTGIIWPTLTSLTSQYSEVDRQGAALGVMQSLSAAARMLGAAWGGWVFGTFSPAAPYIGNSIVMALAAAVAVRFMIKAPARPGAVAERAADVPIG